MVAFIVELVATLPHLSKLMKRINSEHLSMIAAFLYPHLGTDRPGERVTKAVQAALALIEASEKLVDQVNLDREVAEGR